MVSPNMNQSLPLCMNEKPRSVPRRPMVVTVCERVGVGGVDSRSRSPRSCMIFVGAPADGPELPWMGHDWLLCELLHAVAVSTIVMTLARRLRRNAIRPSIPRPRDHG